MFQRVGKKKYKVYAFDIETHNDPRSVRIRETSMWLGCFIDDESKVTDSSSYLYTMDEFLERLSNLTKNNGRHRKDRPINNVLVYVYNLSFEWSFLLPVMMKWGFTHSDDVSKAYTFNSVSTKSVSSVWTATLRFHDDGGVVLFRDLAKIYGGGLSKVARSFKLPTQKGSINYRKNRIRRKGYRISAREKTYCFNDTRIIVDILLQLMGDKDFWQVSSMASYSMKKLIKTGWPRALKPYHEYRKMFPELSVEENEFLRKGVGGGITYAPSNWQFVEIRQKILHIDYHQMHPSQGYQHYFPSGSGEYFTGKPTKYFGYINCVRIRISYDFVRLHSVISLIGIDFIEDREIVVWDFEIPTMEKAYGNLEIEYIDGYCYKAVLLPWRKYYSDNYKKRLVAKANHDAFNTLQYKLLNNSSYGKHLEKPHNEVFANTIRPDGVIDSIVIPKDEKSANAKYTYIPLGSCIPAYSRVDLIETAFKFDWHDVVYFDTDSIFVLATEYNMKVWDSIPQKDFLGNWGFEEMIDQAQFSAPKRYKTISNGITTLKMAGINGFENDVPFDEINITNSKWRVQRAYRCKGGTVIDFQVKTVSVQDKYKSIFQRNTGLSKYSLLSDLAIELNKLT